MFKNILALALCFGTSASYSAVNRNCGDASPIETYAKNPELTEIEMTTNVISHTELLALFPSEANERYFKFPNGLRLYLSKYFKGSPHNRKVWGVYKVDESGKRVLLSMGRFAFVGTFDANEVKSQSSEFYEHATEVAVCNQNAHGKITKVSMLVYPEGRVRAENSDDLGRNSLPSYNSSYFTSGEDMRSIFDNAFYRKMLSYKIREVLFKVGTQSGFTSITQPDGSVIGTQSSEFIYNPIQIIEAQFEGLDEPAILTDTGFQKMSVFYNLNIIKDL